MPGLAAPGQEVHGAVPAVLARLPPIAPLAPTNELHLAIALPLRNPDAPNRLLKELQDSAASPSYHHYAMP